MYGLAPVRLLLPPEPPPNPLAEAHRLKLAASLLAAAARIGRAAGEAIPDGLTPAGLRLLGAFPARSPLRGIDLARNLDADPGQVSRLARVARLVKGLGRVERKELERALERVAGEGE